MWDGTGCRASPADQHEMPARMPPPAFRQRAGTGPSCRDVGERRVTDLLREPALERADPVEVDAGADGHLIQHVDEVLRCDVAGRARREGAPAKAGGAGVEDRNAGADRRAGVGEARVARVVEVRPQWQGPQLADVDHVDAVGEAVAGDLHHAAVVGEDDRLHRAARVGERR